MSDARGVLLVLVLALTAFLARPVQSRTIAAADLDQLPAAFGAWHGADDDSLDAETAAALGADAYLTRTYTHAGGPDVGLYVAHYASQRPGVSVHSPLHCLPGTGWEPLDVATVAVPTPGGGTGAVRQVVMQKNLNRVVVIYWYQLHGRTVASEVRSKLHLLSNSVRRGQSDAALVRVVVPVTGEPGAAAAHGLSFVRDLLPRLAPIL